MLPLFRKRFTEGFDLGEAAVIATAAREARQDPRPSSRAHVVERACQLRHRGGLGARVYFFDGCGFRESRYWREEVCPSVRGGDSIVRSIPRPASSAVQGLPGGRCLPPCRFAAAF